MTLPEINLSAILPVVMLSIFGIAIMVIEPFMAARNRSILAWLGVVGTGAALASVWPMSTQAGSWYSNLWIVDEYSLFFHVMFILVAAVTILISMQYLQREGLHHAEYYALVLFATAGMLVMSGSNELMMLFIGLEILSIATYVLAGFRREDLRSNESAMKYFLLGSFSSAFFLYGVALIFGATGSTNLTVIGEALAGAGSEIGLPQLAAALILIALCFKVAVAPFHVWTPDVYEGAPAPITGFMSVGPKAAGFAILIRVFLTAFPSIQDRWVEVMWLVGALTMVLGNVIAVVQPNIKRMLAYSSIAHAGYIVVALASGSGPGISAALFYALSYSIMNLGAFAVVTMLSRSGDKTAQITDYAGLAMRRPAMAAFLALFLLSLAGVPGTAGFAGKFFIFRSAIESNLMALALIGVATTVVSFYYYLYVIVQMYMHDPREDFEDVRVPSSVAIALAATAAGTLYLGIFPTRIIEWTARAAASVMQ